MDGGIRRDQLWITSKLWNDSHAPGAVAVAFERSLRDLGLDELDLYLVHWPFPNTHAPSVDVESRDSHAQPYVHERYMDTWAALEKLVERGLVRYIGTSNMTIPKLRLLLRDAHIRPAANEMELHPYFQQPELFEFVCASGVTPIGFSPIGSPARPERDRTPSDLVDIEDPVIVAIARRLGVHPAVVCLKWAIQRGQVPIPFATRREHYLSNLRAAVTEPLTDDDMSAIAGDRSRLPPHQGARVPLEARSVLGGPVGPRRHDHPAIAAPRPRARAGRGRYTITVEQAEQGRP